MRELLMDRNTLGKRQNKLHGHGPRSALVLGMGGLVLGISILVLLPTHRIASAVGAAFVLLFALKHLALLLTVASPAGAILAQARAWLRGPRSRPTSPPSPGPDGYYRTGQAEPHKGVVRVDHAVKVLPAERRRQSLVELDVDKRLTIHALSEIDADNMRKVLRERYAKRGFADIARVERFLAGLTGKIPPNHSVVISYDAGSKVTQLAAAGRGATSADGVDFMKATWSLWLGESVPSSLADSLMSNLP
jgi:hypothetical protein